MPDLKGLKPGTISDCLCVFAERLGPAKQTLIAVVQGLIAIMQTAKIYTQLTSINVEDELQKIALEAELFLLETAAAEVIAGINTVIGFGNQFGDCAPIGTFMKIVKNKRDEYIAPIYEMEFQVEQLIASINRKKSKVNKLQGAIDWLNAFLDALDMCGEG